MTDQPADAPAATPARGLLRSSLIVSVMTMLSRVLGLCRDIVFAHSIGAHAGADAFFVAFKIPNFLRRLFAEGAFAQAFVPVLSEYRQQGSHAAVQALVNRVCGCLGVVLTTITVLTIVGTPAVTFLFAPGFWQDPFKFGLVEDMLRLTFPYLLLISMTGLAGSILNSYDRFAIPAFTPVLLNLSLISAALWAAPYFDPPIMALAWGVLLAGVVQLSFQIPFLWQLRLVPKPIVDWKHPGVKRILLLMGPAIFGVSVSQINLLLDTVLASFLPTGSVSWLYYSDRLAELPLGVFAIAIATVILPNLSRQHVGDDSHLFSSTLDWALRLVLLVAMPAAIALVLMAMPILTTLFQNGQTTANDTAMSVLSLRAYSLGLVAFMLIKVLATGYFSRQDTKTPVKVGIIAMVVNMVLNIAFVLPLHFVWQVGHVGLALATSVSAFINAGLLFYGLRRTDAYQPLLGWRIYSWRLLFANMAMAAVIVVFMQYWSEWSDLAVWQRIAQLVVMCTAGLAVYVGALLMAGLRIQDLRQRVVS